MPTSKAITANLDDDGNNDAMELALQALSENTDEEPDEYVSTGNSMVTKAIVHITGIPIGSEGSVHEGRTLVAQDEDISMHGSGQTTVASGSSLQAQQGDGLSFSFGREEVVATAPHGRQTRTCHVSHTVELGDKGKIPKGKKAVVTKGKRKAKTIPVMSQVQDLNELTDEDGF